MSGLTRPLSPLPATSQTLFPQRPKFFPKIGIDSRLVLCCPASTFRKSLISNGLILRKIKLANVRTKVDCAGVMQNTPPIYCLESKSASISLARHFLPRPPVAPLTAAAVTAAARKARYITDRRNGLSPALARRRAILAGWRKAFQPGLSGLLSSPAAICG